MANTNTVGSAVIEIVTFVLTGAVETGVPLVEVRDGDTVSLGEVTTPAILGGNSGVLVTGGDDVSNSVGGGVLGSRAPVVTRARLADLSVVSFVTVVTRLLGSLLGGLLGGLLRLLGSFLSLLGVLLGSGGLLLSES